MQNQEYIEKWLNGTLTPAEQHAFEQTAEYKSLQRLSRALLAFRAPEYDLRDEFQRLHSALATPKKSKVVAMPWMKPLLRIAAMLVLLAGAYFIYLSQSAITITTLASQQETVFLPDSSRVILNASSTVSYRRAPWRRQQRQLTLKGEAFFKVAKGSRFDVLTDAGTVSVLGTEFNVKVRDDYFEVVCYEGQVEVKSQGIVKKLFPSDLFRVSGGQVSNNRVTADNSPTWLRKESSFISVPFSEVLQEFERQYDVTVTVKNVSTDQLFTGKFTHTDLHLALKSISIPLNLTYKVDVDQKNVVLTGEAK